MDYADFLARKALRVEAVGFDALPFAVDLFPFQRDIVAARLQAWALLHLGGLRHGQDGHAVEWARQVCEHTGRRVLILAPLAVSHQTVREAEKFGITGVAFASRPGDTDARIVVTNYQKLSHFDPAQFVGVVLDESSILKAVDGKTRSEILAAFSWTPYRLACSATPAPNDFMELGQPCRVPWA
jgi:hypothetical protein